MKKGKSLYCNVSNTSLTFFLLEKDLNNLGEIDRLCHTVITILNYIMLKP